jgi:hypothetical protein
VRAASVIPGLALAVVDVVVPNLKQSASSKDIFIVEFSERPWLASQWHLNPALSAGLAAEILTFELRGVPLQPVRSQVRTEVLFGGAVSPAAFKGSFERSAHGLGLDSSLEVSDPALGYISGSVGGDPRTIAWLTETALDEGVEGYKAMLGEIRVEDN